MNQAILFDNELTLDDSHVRFNAQQQGQVLVCVISFAQLQQLQHQLNFVEQPVDTGNAVSVFESLRFDIEEWAEDLITQERINEQGEVLLIASE